MARKKASRPLTLTSLRQVRAIAHPLRFRVFERLTDDPRTGKQLAELLGTKPTQLYHHLRVLERAGLIRKVATRKKRGTTEKYFEAVSNRIAIDAKLFKSQVAVQDAILGQDLRLTFDELLEARRLSQRVSPKPPVILKRLRIRTSPARIEQLQRTLDEWLSSYEDAAQENAENEYAVTMALYPTRIGEQSDP